jgi:hypothetical protein
MNFRRHIKGNPRRYRRLAFIATSAFVIAVAGLIASTTAQAAPRSPAHTISTNARSATSATLAVRATTDTTFGPYYLKETYASYRIGAPSLNLYDPVVETLGGRQLLLDNTTGFNYKFRFKADTSKCVAANNAGDLSVIHPCDGSGVVWTAITGNDGCSAVFESQDFSNKYLAGPGNGSQFAVKGLGANGWLYQFRLVNPSTGQVTCF